MEFGGSGGPWGCPPFRGVGGQGGGFGLPPVPLPPRAPPPRRCGLRVRPAAPPAPHRTGLRPRKPPRPDTPLCHLRHVCLARRDLPRRVPVPQCQRTPRALGRLPTGPPV